MRSLSTTANSLYKTECRENLAQIDNELYFDSKYKRNNRYVSIYSANKKKKIQESKRKEKQEKFDSIRSSDPKKKKSLRKIPF